jgi:muramoyltetrapeptide carboxypeptidase LdcA involved in peptidoglycan recycling
MMEQLYLTGSLKGVCGIILGTFLRCEDSSPKVLKKLPQGKNRERQLRNPKPSELQLLRKVQEKKRVLKTIFGNYGERLGIPVAFGMPVGHGPEFYSLPLGAQYRLLPSGQIDLIHWDWLKRIPLDREGELR